MSAQAQTFRIGNYDAVPCEMDDLDARGLLWMWQPPSPNATYTLACDPTVGITGWDRRLRTRDDAKVDNACIQVIRNGGSAPDEQVAEWAAPIDAVDLAAVVNVLGRLYAGANEDGQALAAIEVYPGPGLVTQRELINRFGYMNLPRWEHLDGAVPRATNNFGWTSTRSTRQVLWMRGMNHINRGYIRIHSPWLVEEMTDCTPDNFLAATGRARYGRHDDRVVAMLIAIWFANAWTMTIEPTERGGLEVPNAPDYQRTDCTVEQMHESWSERFSDLIED